MIKVHDIELDTAARKAFRKGEDLKLSGKELALLEYLVVNRNKIATRAEIAEHVWDINFDPHSNVIDSFVKLLRKKIERGPKNKIIRTVRGIGYTISDDE